MPIPEVNLNGPKPVTMVNRITEHQMDSVLDGIILNVETTVTGELQREPDRETTDKDGKKTTIKGAVKRDPVSMQPLRDFPPTKVVYKIDLTGSILRNIVTRAKNDIVVEIGKDLKAKGLKTVQESNGKTFKYADMQLRTARTPKDPVSIVNKSIPTMTKEQKEAMIAMIKASM
jgi:hypothetical protein